MPNRHEQCNKRSAVDAITWTSPLQQCFPQRPISTAIYVDTGSLNKDFLFFRVSAVRSSYNDSDSAETRPKKRRNVFPLIYSRFIASGKQLKSLLTVLTSLKIKTFNITGRPNALVEMFNSLIVTYARGYNSFLRTFLIVGVT